MISIRKRENETIIIQNFKDSYFIFSYIIGIYSALNFLSILRVDINITYKVIFICFSITVIIWLRKSYKNEDLMIRVFIIVNDKKLRIKTQEMRKSKKDKIIFLKDIKEIVLKKNNGAGFYLILKLKNGTEDKTIWTSSYTSELRIIKKIILEHKRKGGEA